MKVVLELQDQPSNVRRITIRHDIVIGRGSDCNLRLSAPQVSRRHCFLRVGRDSVSVTDLDSSNGTFVDGRRIAAGKRCDITDGVQLALGPIRFIVHVRVDAVVANRAGVKSQTGISNEFAVGDSGRYSAGTGDSLDDSSTIDGRSLSAQSKVPMDFTVEQGGDSAEPHATTAEELERQSSASGAAGIFSPELNPTDSRLEIVDFGRRLSEESAIIDETRPVSRMKKSGKSESAEDGMPRWAASIMDSSEDMDVLSMADDSSVHCNSQDERTVKSQGSISDAKKSKAGSSEEVLETAEFFKAADDVYNGDGESNWFSDDDADSDPTAGGPDAGAESEAADPIDDDEIEPNRQDFPKGS